MNMDLSEAWHVVFGDSAAGSLRVALRLAKGRILVNEDPLSCGPAPETHNLSQWRAIRESFLQDMYLDWPEFSLDEYADNGLLSNTQRLADGKPIVVWAAPSLGEQLLIAWLTVLFKHMQIEFSNLFVVQFQNLHPRQPVRGIGELSPKSIQEFAPQPIQLSGTEISEYQAAWLTYTSSRPSDLLRFLDREPASKALVPAMKQLIYRYPSTQTGLSRCDEELISYTATKGPKAARIVGHTMGFGNDLDPLGDQYVFHRLRRLGDPNLACPLIALSGDCLNMRTCEAQLTDFGRDVLAGRANAMEANGIDDWIGGVHLNLPESAPRRDDDTLLIYV